MREEVIGGWRKLHNEDLRDLYFSPHIVTVLKYHNNLTNLIHFHYHKHFIVS
jgi:hypothetical protein